MLPKVASRSAVTWIGLYRRQGFVRRQIQLASVGVGSIGHQVLGYEA